MCHKKTNPNTCHKEIYLLCIFFELFVDKVSVYTIFLSLSNYLNTLDFPHNFLYTTLVMTTKP